MARKGVQTAALRLQARLDLTAAEPLREAILAHRGKPLAIDAASVQRVGVQCIQVLLAAVATWKADGIGITLNHASADLAEAVRLLGISPEELSMEGVAS